MERGGRDWHATRTIEATAWRKTDRVTYSRPRDIADRVTYSRPRGVKQEKIGLEEKTDSKQKI